MKKLLKHPALYLISSLILILTVFAPVALAADDDAAERERAERLVAEQERANALGDYYVPSEGFSNDQERMDMEAAAGNSTTDDRFIQWEILIGQWERDGYPDDIGGAYYDSDAGTMGFLLVNYTPERIEELRLLVSDQATITPCKYSYNELRLAQAEINSIIGADSGIYSTSVGWTSTDGRVHGFGESGKEFRLEVGVDESVYDHYSEGFAALYGDRVVVKAIDPSDMPREAASSELQSDGSSIAKNPVTYEGGLIVPVDISVALAGSAFNTVFVRQQPLIRNNWIIPAILILLCGVAVALYFNRARLIPAMQTNTGNVVTGRASVSRKQTIAAIKNSALAPSDDAFKSIMEQVDSRKPGN